MKKKLALVLCAVLVLGMFFPGCGKREEPSPAHPAVLMDYVVDVGTITAVDEAAALKAMDTRSSQTPGGCSCVVTQVDGKNLVGRNMGLAITENTAFKFMLDMNQYRAIGIAYTSFRDLKFADVKANGVSKEFLQALPFIASDYLNEAGLYIETNMRNGESGFECTGTNPGAEVSVNAVGLPAYLASRCATVDEAVALVKSLNIWTPTEPVAWNFAFMLADAEGSYGLLEIAKDKVIFSPGRNGQANFYYAPEFAADAQYQTGEARYACINEGLENVKTQDQMLKQMQKVYYSQCYDLEHLHDCPFDIRSEFIESFPVDEAGNVNLENGSLLNCTSDWVLDDSHVDLTYDCIAAYVSSYFGAYRTDSGYDFAAIRADAKNHPDFWVSAYSFAVDCSAKTMKAHFWENTDITLDFSFR